MNHSDSQNSLSNSRSKVTGEAAAIGQLLNKRYRIIKVLGSGSFGPTYLAADTHRPGLPHCVVKQLCPYASGVESLRTARRLFQKEAEILEKLGKHDRLPQLLAYFEENHQLYLVKEFIPGHPLTDEIVPGHPLTSSEVGEILRSVLEILVFVHGQGVIHRDIKPANLIRRQEDKALVLIDFGSVKEIGNLINGDRTRTVAAGTPVYMPVEQFQGNPQFNSDLYALGTIAVQALTGLSAQSLPKLQNLESRVCWRDRCQVEAGLADIIDKMVEYSSGQRYGSASEVLSALDEMEAEVTRMPSSTASTVKTDASKASILVRAIPGSSFHPQQKPSRSWILRRAGLGAVVLILLGAGGWGLKMLPGLGNVEKLYLLGEEKMTEGDESGALADFDRAISIAPEEATGYYKRGNAHYDLGNLDEAIADYTQAIQLDPTQVDFYYNRGWARSQLKDFQGAIDDFDRAIELKPNDADAFYQRGLAAYDLGDYQAAINDYTQAILFDAENPNAYQSRGLAYSALGDKQKAMADYTQAIAVDAENPMAYYSRGRARYALGDYTGALEDYTRTLELDDRNADAYTNRCSVQLNLGKYDRAIADCTRGLEIDPRAWVAYSNRCVARYNLQQYPEAIEDCTQALELSPNHAKAYSNRGMARTALGQIEAAIDDYTQAIRLNPHDAVAYSNRGLAYAESKDYRKAIEDQTQAIRLNPELGVAYFNRGTIRRQMNDRPGAIEDFQRAATTCLDRGMVSCYDNAQSEIGQLK
ncbi:tetratricopeptide repeat protein [Oscillatoriales cyanobacterium LEGE 11467]|uniref:Tetratricopeptide repeat protein n=1 Tax=Zarconia navalis LEGE 11467 TaxID=1828826 RepID=A0A928W3K6_9CYAN|nr:serine/threonine-protein kinase [Zarconia navalis]MBE9042570.1 tetratricopeptide repeat protein [Zarconia navalis LEGE 11467]